MGPRLLPCPGCSRHVRVVESLCPFCGEALPLAYQSAGPAVVPSTRLGRAAQIAFGAAVAGVVAVTGCGDDGTGSDTGTGDTGVVDTGTGDTGTSDTGTADGGGDAAMDTGGPAPAYGAPADVGPADSGPPDDGSSMALYGAPPEP